MIAEDIETKQSKINRKGTMLEFEFVYMANRDAMLQALRVVLDLPRKPISLKEIDGTETNSLAISGK